MSMRVMPFVLAALLGVAAAGLVACGGGGDRSDLIPQRSADRLKSALSDVRSAVDDGDCEEAAQAVSRARGVLVNLPSAVDERLVARLEQGLDNLETVAPRECEQQATQTQTQETTTAAPETTPEDTTPTDTAPEETTTTDTTPPETTTTAPPETTTTAPPETTTTAPAPAPGDPSGGTTTP
jgi:hypothetical protein